MTIRHVSPRVLSSPAAPRVRTNLAVVGLIAAVLSACGGAASDFRSSRYSSGEDLAAALPIRCDELDWSGSNEYESAFTCTRDGELVLWVQLDPGARFSRSDAEQMGADLIGEQAGESCEHWGGGPFIIGANWFGIGELADVEEVAAATGALVYGPVDCGPDEPEPTTTAAAIGDAVPRSLGAGRPVGVSADGALAYVASIDPESTAVGCEGAPPEYLWAVDPDTGERVAVTGDGTHLASGRILADRNGSTVFVSRCDGFVTGITLYPSSDPFDLSPGTPLPFTGAVPLVTWATEGAELLLGVVAGEDRVDVHVVAVEGGDAFVVVSGPVTGIGKEAGDRYVWSDGSAIHVTDGSGTELMSYPGDTFAMSPWGGELAIVSGSAVRVGPTDGDHVARAEWPGAWLSDVAWSADGAIAYLRHGTGPSPELIVTGPAGDSRVVAADVVPPFYFLAAVRDDWSVNHRRLVYAVRGPDHFETFVVDL